MSGLDIVFARDVAHKALSRVAKVCPSAAAIPILNHILVERDDNGLRFTATDMDVWLSVEVHAQGKTFTPFCAPAALAQIVAALPAGAEICLAATKEALGNVGGTIDVIAGRARFTLPILPASDFPAAPHPDEVSFEVSAGAIAMLLARTKWAVSAEETRYYLNGVFLDTTAKGALRATATNGSLLARCDGPDPEGADAIAELANKGLIIPTRAVATLHGMLDDNDATVTLDMANEALAVTLEPWRLVTKLIDGTFPDADRVFPAIEGLVVCEVKAEALKAALARVTIVDASTHAIRLYGQKGMLIVDSNRGDGAMAREEIDAAWRDAAAVAQLKPVGFNSKYLKTLIDGLAGDTLTLMLAADGTGPSMVRVLSRDDLVAIIMPMRV